LEQSPPRSSPAARAQWHGGENVDPDGGLAHPRTQPSGGARLRSAPRTEPRTRVASLTRRPVDGRRLQSPLQSHVPESYICLSTNKMPRYPSSMLYTEFACIPSTPFIRYQILLRPLVPTVLCRRGGGVHRPPSCPWSGSQIGTSAVAAFAAVNTASREAT